MKDRSKYTYSFKENDRVSQDQGRNRNRSPINYAAEAARYNQFASRYAREPQPLV